MTTHRVFLIGSEDNETAIFTELQAENGCTIKCEYRGKEIAATESDFFEALCVVRRELEKELLIPFCYGASMNVFPSKTSREMALGKLAYKMEVGKPSAQEQLVHIFDDGADVIPASVDHQLEYFNEWRVSLD